MMLSQGIVRQGQVWHGGARLVSPGQVWLGGRVPTIGGLCMGGKLLVQEKYNAEKDRLWSITKELPRGALVTHQMIEKAVGFKRHTSAYKTIAESWKNRVRRERYIEVVAAKPIGTGYRLATADEQVVENPQRHTKRAVKIIKRTADNVAMTPTLELSPDGRRWQAVRTMQLTDAQAMLKADELKNRCFRSNPDKLPRLPME